MNVTEERKTLYKNLEEELHKRQLSNNESFDKSVLTLSSAGLAFSVSMIKSVIPINDAIFIGCLYAAWVLFGLTIVSTILSLITSQSGINTQLEHSYKYYIELDDSYLNKRNNGALLTEFFNKASGLFFICAIISVVAFSILNLDKPVKSPRSIFGPHDGGAQSDSHSNGLWSNFPWPTFYMDINLDEPVKSPRSFLGPHDDGV